MSRCASGSSSSSSPGRRARQAASATSLRWPPLSSRVGRESASSSSPSAGRCARASLSARSPPSSRPARRAAAPGWRARARACACRRPARGRRGGCSACASSRSSALSSGRASSTVASAARSSPSTICGSEASTSPRRLVTVPASGCSSPGEDPQQRRLAAAVGPEHADARARGELEVEPGQHLAAAERLRRCRARTAAGPTLRVLLLRSACDPSSIAFVGGVAVLPAVDLDVLALRLLVHRVEVLDLGAQLARQVVELLDLVPGRIVGGDADELVAAALLVGPSAARRRRAPRSGSRGRSRALTHTSASSASPCSPIVSVMKP